MIKEDSKKIFLDFLDEPKDSSLYKTKERYLLMFVIVFF